MLAELTALALACAPNIHPITLDALIRHESGARQYAIGVNHKGKALSQQPHDLEAANQAAEKLIAQGIDFDAGLGQINVRNWDWLGLTSTTVFDPCRNLAAAQMVLSDCYARALNSHRDQQQALRAALSCYNTGNFHRGFANGYVGKVLAQAGIQVPALKPVAHPGGPSVEPAAAAETGTAASHPAAITAGNDPENPDRSPNQRDESAETTLPGAPDGFTAYPTADGFSHSPD
ncbi:lytic transglycosylase domain-containing protein [Castellaniella sp. S9]|uniref:lytic transglycosylase domain-containing protein n=1 Tax=Castellaniella sp. S9 TaxID=2993652 RepID=UPI0022B32429|nr:lytic transglycosylase domain-containing protein [Castellaniella sp. S9]